MTRRSVLQTLAAAAALARESRPQAAAEKNGGPRAGVEAGARTRPLVCAFSKNLAKIPYAQLGLIASQMGYDGVDLTVMQGGHVNPNITNVDLVRAVESVRGAGVEVPMITTDITSQADAWAYAILAITSRVDVNLFRTGFWPWGSEGNIPKRLAQIRNDIVNTVALGKQNKMVAMFPNRAGSFFGSAFWDAQSVLADLDPAWIGYYFDPSQTQTWEPALRYALPRLKAVAVQDGTWQKVDDRWMLKPCPLGDGMVDWQVFFRILAQARFTGPVSIHFEYQAQDEVSAMTKDLEFVRTQIDQAWNPGPVRRIN